MTRRWQFEQSQIIPRPRSEVFAFFADAQNLEKLTPDFLGFKILNPGPIEMAPGAIIDYSIRLYGVPMKWKTRIKVFVRRALERIFRHRRRAVSEIFGSVETFLR